MNSHPPRPAQPTGIDPIKVRHYQELKFKVSFLKKPKDGKGEQGGIHMQMGISMLYPSSCASIPDDTIFVVVLI